MAERKCEVCKEVNFMYKCPVCLIKFCSVACYKSHKGSEQCVKPIIENPLNKNKKNLVPEYEFETEDSVKVEKLCLLGKDKKILKTLENPHLREMIKYLNSTNAPAQGMEQAMKEPIFVEFVENCLRVVEGEETSDSSDDDSS